MSSTQFDNYIIYHHQENGNADKAVITCFMGDRTVGFIKFVEGHAPEAEILPNGILQLYFSFARLNEIINTIRYEKPLYISIYGSKSVLSTVHEPVGEQEGT